MTQENINELQRCKERLQLCIAKTQNENLKRHYLSAIEHIDNCIVFISKAMKDKNSNFSK